MFRNSYCFDKADLNMFANLVTTCMIKWSSLCFDSLLKRFEFEMSIVTAKRYEFEACYDQACAAFHDQNNFSWCFRMMLSFGNLVADSAK